MINWYLYLALCQVVFYATCPLFFTTKNKVGFIIVYYSLCFKVFERLSHLPSELYNSSSRASWCQNQCCKQHAIVSLSCWVPDIRVSHPSKNPTVRDAEAEIQSLQILYSRSQKQEVTDPWSETMEFFLFLWYHNWNTIKTIQ